MTLAILVFAFLVLGIVPTRVRAVIDALVSYPLRRIAARIEELQRERDQANALREAMRAQYDGAEGAHAMSLVIGAVIATGMHVLFLAVDLHGIALALSHMLDIEKPPVVAAFDAYIPTLLAVGLLIAASFGEWLKHELKSPTLLRTRHLDDGTRYAATRQATVLVQLALVSLVAVAAFRGYAAAASEEPGTAEFIVLLALQIGVSVCTLVALFNATKLSFRFGPTTLLGLVALTRSAPAAVRGIWLRQRLLHTLTWIEGIVLVVYDLLETIAVGVVQGVVRTARSLHQAARQGRIRPNVLTGVVLLLTAWSGDATEEPAKLTLERGGAAEATPSSEGGQRGDTTIGAVGRTESERPKRLFG